MKKNFGTRDRGDIWLANLASQINRACDYFWTRTPERRIIEARRRARRFFDQNLPVDKPFSHPEKPDN
jgi:hypothetical protein